MIKIIQSYALISIGIKIIVSNTSSGNIYIIIIIIIFILFYSLDIEKQNKDINTLVIVSYVIYKNH